MNGASSLLVVVGFTGLALACATLSAQQPAEPQASRPPSVLDGIYTDAQAARGERVYFDTCAPCHGDLLKGAEGLGAPLTGPDFLNAWSDKSVGALLDKISIEMPMNTPGSLTPQESADVLAYILRFNRYPAGRVELPTDSAMLQMVMMAQPAP